MLVSRRVDAKVWTRGTHLSLVEVDIGEDVVHVIKRVLDDQDAQHARREDGMHAVDARTTLCVCKGIGAWYTPMGGGRRCRRRCGTCGKRRPR